MNLLEYYNALTRPEFVKSRVIFRGFFISNHRISRFLTNYLPYYSGLEQVNPDVFMYFLRT